MNISLTPELERLINRKVKTGMYQTASEVVREALRVLKERDDDLARLKADIQKGFDEIERGEFTDYDEKSTPRLLAEIKARGRKRLDARARAKKK